MRFLSRFFPSPPLPSIPEGRRIYAVGDVHGCCSLLKSLIEQIDQDSAKRGQAHIELLFLGDLVDRGPDSRGVVELLIALSKRRRIHLLKGNHEELFIAAAKGVREAARGLMAMGGRETLLSYGILESELDSGTLGDLVDLIGRRVPGEHIEFLDNAHEHLKIGNYLFVHAGVRPGVPIEDQCPQEMRWIRTEFTRSTRDHGNVVVHGHTISEQVEVRPNRIGVDTGAYASGRLSALGLEGSQQWVISAQGS